MIKVSSLFSLFISGLYDCAEKIKLKKASQNANLYILIVFMAFDIQPPKKPRKSAPTPAAKQESVVVQKKKPALKKVKKVTPPKPAKNKPVKPKQTKKIPKKKQPKQVSKNNNSFLKKMFFVGIGIFVVIVVVVAFKKSVTQLSQDKNTKAEVKSGIVQTFSNPNPVDVISSQPQSDKQVSETPKSVLLEAHNNFVKNLSAVVDTDIVVPEIEYDMTDQFRKYLEEF